MFCVGPASEDLNDQLNLPQLPAIGPEAVLDQMPAAIGIDDQRGAGAGAVAGAGDEHARQQGFGRQAHTGVRQFGKGRRIGKERGQTAGDGYLRRLLVSGAQSLITANQRRRTPDPWIAKLLASKSRMETAVALANKLARIAWAVMTRQTNFRAAAPA